MRPNLMSYEHPHRMDSRLFHTDGTPTDFLENLVDRIKKYAYGSSEKDNRYSVYEMYVVGSQAKGMWLNSSDLDVICIGDMPDNKLIDAADDIVIDISLMNDISASNEGVDVPYGISYDMLNRQWVCDTHDLDKISELTDRIRSGSDNVKPSTLYRWRADYLCGIGRLDEAFVNFEKCIELGEKPPFITGQKFMDRLLELKDVGVI